MLDRIFVWLYCMDYQQITAVFLVFSGVFYIARRFFAEKKFWKPAIAGVLLLWALAVGMQTLFRRTPSAPVAPVWMPFQSYIDALVAGGQRELLRSNFMNAALFYPGGLLAMELLPQNWRSGRRFWVMLGVMAGLSLVIELAQYRFGLGLAQTDDVLHNALGAAVGGITWILLRRGVGRMERRGTGRA